MDGDADDADDDDADDVDEDDNDGDDDCGVGTDEDSAKSSISVEFIG